MLEIWVCFSVSKWVHYWFKGFTSIWIQHWLDWIGLAVERGITNNACNHSKEHHSIALEEAGAFSLKDEASLKLIVTGMDSLSLIIVVMVIFLSHDIFKRFPLSSLVKKDVVVVGVSVWPDYMIRFNDSWLELFLTLTYFSLVEFLIDRFIHLAQDSCFKSA